MNENQLNIKTSAIEKGLELAKGFVDKLIGPTIEEVGLLLSDNIKYFRFKNQVKILLKAKKYVEERNISTKEIPLKILVPLLEKASLEEDESLQDKWAKMITNLADSDKNLQNQIFPYILSQISSEEYAGLAELYLKESEYLTMRKKLHELKKEDGSQLFSSKSFKELEGKISEIEQGGFWVSLDGFEFSNLERLGLIKQSPPKIEIEEFKTGSGYVERGEMEEWHLIEAKYETDDYGCRITELGDKFIDILELKSENASG